MTLPLTDPFLTYLYDLCGNMIVRNGAATGSQALAYDGENQLTNFSQAGTVVAQYGYDADGARLWKQLNQDPAQVQVWIGKIYEEKNDQTIQHVKHTLFHVFAGDQQICTFEAGSPLDGGSVSGAIGYYYHEDNISSSSVLSAANAAQLEVDAYYPFGRTETATPQAPFQVSRRFTGQVLDAESGLYYYNARYYDPELGRFIQPDDVIQDLSNPQSYNRYSYCVNDPLRYTDPTGKDFVLNAGLVNGPVPYMTARSTLGQIGASVYNMFPLVDNSIHQVLRGVAAVDHAAGDVLQATTLAVTGDPQLAENSRNVTLLIGGVGEIGKVAKIEETASGAIVKYDAKFALQQGANPATVVPDPYAVVRGGQAPMPAAGTTFSGSMGATVSDAAAGVPHGTIRSTTAGAVREQGGSVVLAPEATRSGAINQSHVNVTEGSSPTVFGPPAPNPVPKSERVQ